LQAPACGKKENRQVDVAGTNDPGLFVNGEMMKILVGVEDPKSSQGTLQAVIAQFNPKVAEIRVVHVVAPMTYFVPPEMAADYVPELQEQTKEGREIVERAANTLRTAGFTVDTSVLVGDVRVMIIDAAAEWHADMIVIGSHGRKGLQRFLLGSVAEFVARHATCSVQIVRSSSNQ
jgi:nucleotide-binding universal stress UspA family protein